MVQGSQEFVLVRKQIIQLNRILLIPVERIEDHLRIKTVQAKALQFVSV